MVERGVGPDDAPGLGVHQEDVLGSLLDHASIEFLALAKSVFGVLAFGHVALVDHHSPHVRVIQQIVDEEFRVAPRTVLARHLELERRVDAGLRQELGEYVPLLLEVLWAYVVEDALAHQVFGVVARHPLDRRADVAYGAVGVDHRDDVGGVLHQGAEALLALMKRSLGLLAFGNVEHHALPEAWDTLLVPHQHGLVPDPHNPAVAGDLTVLHPEGFTGLVCAPILSQDPFAVFGMQQLDPKFGVFHEGLGWMTRLRLYLRAGVQSWVGPTRARFG